MNSQDIEATEANTIDDVVQQIMAIDGPCSCESQLCLHWRTEAGIILAGFLSDRDFDAVEYRRGVKSCADIALKYQDSEMFNTAATRQAEFIEKECRALLDTPA